MDGLKFPTVGAELRSGCIMVELSMRLPRDGRMSVRGRHKGALPCASRRCPRCALRVIRGRFSGTGETRATKLPKPSAAVFAQVLLATNCTPARASLRDSLSLGGYALGFPPRAGVSPSPWTLPLRGEAGRWPALVVARGAAMPRQRDLESAAEDISANCLAEQFCRVRGNDKTRTLQTATIKQAV